MPVPSSISDLSTTPSLNSPAGTESPSTVDDYLRTQAAFIKQVDDKATGTVKATDLAASGGSALVGYGSGTVEQALQDHEAVLANVEGNLNFATLPSASLPADDADLLLIRQGSANKKIAVSVVRSEFAVDAEAAEAGAIAAKTAAETAKTAAETAKTAAETAKTAAEAARDATVSGAAPTIYAAIAAGLAATTSGKYFSVPSTDGSEYLILYLNNAGAAVEVKRYPSANALTGLNKIAVVDSVAGHDYAASATAAVLGYRTSTLGSTPTTGTANALDGTFIFPLAPQPAGVVKSFAIQGAGTKTIKLKRLTRSGRVFTFVEEFSFNIVSGLNTFSLDNGNLPTIKLNEGDVLALYMPANSTYYNVVSSGSPTAYYLASATDVTTTYTLASDASPGGTISLPLLIEVDSSPRSSELLPVLTTQMGEKFIIGPASPQVGDGYVANGKTYISNYSAPEGGLLKTIRAYAENRIKLIVYVIGFDASANTFSVLRQMQVQLEAGANTLTAGTHFPPGIVVPKGGYVGHYYGDDQAFGLRAVVSNKQAFYWSIAGAPKYSYTASEFTASAVQDREHQISYEFQSAAPAERNPYLIHQKFDAVIPHPWVAPTWAISGGAAVSSSGFAASLAYYSNRFSTRVNGAARFEVTLSAGETLALFRRVIGGSGGTVVTIETDTGILAFRNDWNGGTTLPAVAKSKTLAFAPVAGRRYRVELIKAYRTITATVTDTVTGQSDSLSNYYPTSALPGLMLGSPGFANVAGTSTVYSAVFIPTIRRPSVMLFGDSITEGSNATLDSDSWAYKVCTNANGGGLTSAKGGEASGSTITHIAYELRAYRPKYAIVMIGTNDTNMTTWQTNMTIMESMIRSAGAIPIFCTLPPEAADTNPVNVQNPFIRSSGWRYIDMARAMTVNGDGTTRNEALFSDALHPNDAGMLAMYSRVRLDVPELFD